MGVFRAPSGRDDGGEWGALAERLRRLEQAREHEHGEGQRETQAPRERPENQGPEREFRGGDARNPDGSQKRQKR